MYSDKYPKMIYAIQHNITHRIYVGMTVDLEWRISKHMSDLRNGCHTSDIMQNDCNKYGADYSVYVLDNVASGAELWKEKYYMHIYHTDDPELGYNSNDNRFRHTKYKVWRYKSGAPEVKRKEGE